MNVPQVMVRELVAWGVDENPNRPQIDGIASACENAAACASALTPFVQEDPRADDIPANIASALAVESVRPDLIEEMNSLDWTTGIIDLTRLVSFQRRVVVDENESAIANDWQVLIALAFGPIAPIAYDVIERNGSSITIETENPNLQFRTGNTMEAPFVLHGGSPFFEVAEYRHRWFLRDGYHRAYRLLRNGISHVPAVIVRAKTLAELGPVQPWFFAEQILFSARPPLVTDFLNDTLTMTYTRPRLQKTLRVTMVETVEPATTHDMKETI